METRIYSQENLFYKQNIRTNSSSQNWKLDQIELESLFCERTKAIILNNPNNPLGKVFKKDELMLIAGLCKKWNVLCISDEVYEWLCFNDSTHTRICALAGMWERTITIGSVGKSFSVTGWKIGWAYGCHNLIKSLRLAHLVTCGTQMQVKHKQILTIHKLHEPVLVVLFF